MVREGGGGGRNTLTYTCMHSHSIVRAINMYNHSQTQNDVFRMSLILEHASMNVWEHG